MQGRTAVFSNSCTGITHDGIIVVTEDPNETRDISSEHPDVVTRLLHMLEEEQIRIKKPIIGAYDELPYPYTSFVDSQGHLQPGYCDGGSNPTHTYNAADRSSRINGIFTFLFALILILGQ